MMITTVSKRSLPLQFFLIYSIKASNVSFVAVCAFGFKGLIWRNMGKIKEIAEHGIL